MEKATTPRANINTREQGNVEAAEKGLRVVGELVPELGAAVAGVPVTFAVRTPQS